MTARERELATGLARTWERIDRACAAAGRTRSEITLVVVTKTWPVDDIRRLVDLGVADVGENRAQELIAKRADLGPGSGLRWHFIGGLQTNKARAVGEAADLVQSVDRPELVDPLGRGAQRAGVIRDCLVQVSLDPREPDGDLGPGSGRSGVLPSHAVDLARTIETDGRLRVAGVMGVAPLGGDAAAAFAALAGVGAEVRSAFPGARIVSAGMSGDLEEAVAAGATHLRVGSAILGGRAALG